MKTRMKHYSKGVAALTLLLSSLLLAFAASEGKKEKELPSYGNWQRFDKENGLPSDKAYCVRIVGERVLVGTHDGLAVFENKTWKVYTQEDGLPHNGVLSIDVSESSGDVWIGTMGGLTRWSGGRFQNFTQLNSGMPNDLIYSVTCTEREVWVATAGGAGKYDTFEETWEIFTEQNAPMHEPWTYGISAGDGKVYIAAWGGGVVEYTQETKKFRDYTDPDGNMEIDLFPDDGVVHDITTGTSWSDGYLWVATYFGLSRYDGVHWKGYFDHDSGLASNFINFIKARDGIAYICTDKGLSTTNGTNWNTYTDKAIAHNYVLGVDVNHDEIWVATSDGISRGERLNQRDEASRQLN